MIKKHKFYKSWFFNLLLILFIISLLVFDFIIGILHAIKYLLKTSILVDYKFEIFCTSSLVVCLITFFLMTFLITIFIFLLKRFINQYYYQSSYDSTLNFFKLLKKEKLLIANGITILLCLITEFNGILIFNNSVTTIMDYHKEMNQMLNLLLLNLSLFNNLFLILFILFFTNWKAFKAKLSAQCLLSFSLLLVFNQNRFQWSGDKKNSCTIIYNKTCWARYLLSIEQWWQIKLNKINDDFKNLICGQVFNQLINDSKAQNQILF